MTKRITHLFLLLFFFVGISNSILAQGDENPFRPIADFDAPEGVNFFRDPGGSGQTTGVIFQNEDLEYITYRSHNVETVNPATESIGSMELGIVWNLSDTLEWFEPTAGGFASHYVRLWSEPGNANVDGKRFLPGQAIEVYLYGDGKGNRFRFMVRDALFNLEGSEWITVDWTGWKRLTWDYNDAANVFGWVNGNGEMDLNAEGAGHFYFDSFHITRDVDGTTEDVLFYFDDLRIVEAKFDVDFNIAGADGSEVVSIEGVTYDQGQTDFQYFPGEYEFFVQKDGFLTYNGTFMVDDQGITVDVTLDAGTDPEYDVTFTVLDTEGGLLSDFIISINGEAAPLNDNVFNLTPGYYTYTVVKDLFFDTAGSFKVLDANLFINVELEEIPDVYDNIYLKWDVASTANTVEFRAETYSVWVATVADDQQEFNPEDYEMVFEETLGTDISNWVYQPRMVELSGYQSQNIRVAFRHFNSTDNDRVVIDNVRIEALDRVEEVTDLYLDEDFEGGLPEGFDPNTFDPGQPDAYDDTWLPENWSAINNDTDTLNWYFAIRLNQDLSYQTHMRSQSYDPDAGALTPDNWLVTPYIELPMVISYNVAFNVVDVDGNAITDAKITFNGMEYEAGDYDIAATSGEYAYEVSLEGYITESGTVTVGREDVAVDVTLLLPEVYEVTFIVDMRESASFEPGETNIYMSGTFPGWDFAVPGTYPEQQLNPTNNVFFFTQTLQMIGGTYSYKYFDGTSLDDAEWPGEPFRQIVVDGDMEITDVFGMQVSVDEVADAAQASIFPNPASNRVQISTASNMSRVVVFNISGQQVYTHSAEGISHTINLDGFNEGIYLIQVVTSKGVATQKLQVVK